MKIAIAFIVVLLIAGCNDQPLPAFVDNKQKCQEINCGELQYSGLPVVTYYQSNTMNSYPDKNYDQILGHHDYSGE